MSDAWLTQVLADHFLGLEKYRIDDVRHPFPDDAGGRINLHLKSADEREDFQLDLWRGGINLKKGTYQNRSRKTIILARLDFDGPPHRNPDGEEVGSPHMHVYKEGYGDKWAYPLPESFINADDRWQLLQDFMTHCNIIRPPLFNRGLFG